MRALVLVTALAAAVQSGGCGAGAVCDGATGTMADFIRVENGRFYEGDRPYEFVGTNLWYGMSLASTGPGGDRDRLRRELDRLRDLGVRNVRIMAGSEGPATEPWRVAPPLQRAPGDYDDALLEGLDYLLSELGQRGLRAVVCLTNFWFWSGGMSQYLAWNGAGDIPYPLSPDGSWHEYMVYTARFYSDAAAIADYEQHVARLLERENTVTGSPYRDDPTIMAWELANEPRGMDNGEAMRAWIHRTAGFIKARAPRHLVTTGSEGDTDFPPYNGMDFVRDHQSPHIDYATIHLWVQNWLWFDPENEASYVVAEARALEYLRGHLDRARELGKPVVFEEFGIARDGGSFAPAASTRLRDRYYTTLLEEVLLSASRGGPLRGANFWSWAGEGRPASPVGGSWQVGLPWTGDPPHEPQGWYGVYDTDETTHEVLRRFASAMNHGPECTERDSSSLSAETSDTGE